MKLVQKLSIAMSLACAMTLSSCSKEDAQAPVPQTEKATENLAVKTDASLRKKCDSLVVKPQLPSGTSLLSR